MNRPVQRLIIVALALMLVVPLGVMGLGPLLGPDPGSDEPTAATPSDRPTMDPADQPPRPDLPRPDEPAVMTEQSAEGAEATLTYLLESYDYMMSSGDTSVWEDSVSPDCTACNRFLDNAEVLAEQDGYLVDGAFTVHSTLFSGTGEPPTSGTAVADFTQEPSLLVDDPTLQPLPLEEVSGQILASMSWEDGRWLVTDMAIAPPTTGPSDGGGSGGTGGGGAAPSDGGGS